MLGLGHFDLLVEDNAAQGTLNQLVQHTYSSCCTTLRLTKILGMYRPKPSISTVWIEDVDCNNRETMQVER